MACFQVPLICILSFGNNHKYRLFTGIGWLTIFHIRHKTAGGTMLNKKGASTVIHIGHFNIPES
jgi:hypothetical protein